MQGLGNPKPQLKTLRSGHAEDAGSILATRDVLDEDLDQDGLRCSVKRVRRFGRGAESRPIYGRESSCAQLHLVGRVAAQELHVPEQVNHTPFSEGASLKIPEESLQGMHFP